MTARPTSQASKSGPALSDREQRLELAIEAYLEAVQAGRPPDRAGLLARHSDLAADLISFFAGEDRLRGVAQAILPHHDPGDEKPKADTSQGSSPNRDLSAPMDFGDYELIEEIARGGMGVVFKARDKKLGRIVALKTIRPAALGPVADALHRFRIEAAAVARLDHPHIVPIYEMAEFAGFPFISLKLVAGGDLERHVARFKDHPRAIARLMKDVAQVCIVDRRAIRSLLYFVQLRARRSTMHTCAASCTATCRSRSPAAISLRLMNGKPANSAIRRSARCRDDRAWRPRRPRYGIGGSRRQVVRARPAGSSSMPRYVRVSCGWL